VGPVGVGVGVIDPASDRIADADADGEDRTANDL
jgi:hypothetical protein